MFKHGGGGSKPPRSLKLTYNFGKVQKFKQTSYRKEESRDDNRLYCLAILGGGVYCEVIVIFSCWFLGQCLFRREGRGFTAPNQLSSYAPCNKSQRCLNHIHPKLRITHGMDYRNILRWILSVQQTATNSNNR